MNRCVKKYLVKQQKRGGGKARQRMGTLAQSPGFRHRKTGEGSIPVLDLGERTGGGKKEKFRKILMGDSVNFKERKILQK